MEPDQKKLKPSTSSGFGGDGTNDTNRQLNQPYDATVSRRFAIRTGNEGVVIVSRSVQQSGRAQSTPLGNEGSTEGLIRKKLTVLIKRAGYDILDFNTAAKALVREIADLKTEELDLGRRIREVQEKIISSCEDDNNQRWHFLSEEDLKSLPCLQNKMLFVVKAPPDTTIARDPSQRGVTFRSTSGEINVYLTSQYQEILQINPGQEAPVIPEPADVRENEEIYAQGIVAPNHSLVDDDCWLLSDKDGGTADTWTAPEIDWDEFDASVANENASVPVPINDAIENEINPRTACLNASTSQDIAAVTTNNMPDNNNDADYWLLSNDEPSISDLWADQRAQLRITCPHWTRYSDKKPSEDDTTRS